MPQPFQRPGVSLSTEKREWRDVPVASLQIGDIARGWGLVAEVDLYPEETVIVWKSGTRSLFSPGDTVTAFVKV